MGLIESKTSDMFSEETKKKNDKVKMKNRGTTGVGWVG